MARIANQDYFIFEPAMLRDGRFCVPFRWFTRGNVLHAKCWELRVVASEHGSQWRAIVGDGFEVSQHDLLKNFPDLQSDHELYGVPHPSNIQGQFLCHLTYLLSCT